MEDFLKECDNAYYAGNPIISDSQYDALRDSYEKQDVGAGTSNSAVPHLFRMYSLNKYYVGEDTPPTKHFTIKTPKLDGAAISLLYLDGNLIRALTRGNGIKGEDITDKALLMDSIPDQIPYTSAVQITGEVVAPKMKNSRNYASGALNLKDLNEFRERTVDFVAYGMDSNSHLFTAYEDMLDDLNAQCGFKTVISLPEDLPYPTDGEVHRVSDMITFGELGYTNKHPRGAWAIKERTEGIKTVLEDIVWQVGKSGKVTPVALLAPIEIDGAVVSRATLNNIGFIRELDLELGCEVMVERSGGIIPRIINKV